MWEVASSKLPVAESNCSTESNVKKKLVPSSVVLTILVLVPEKAGFWVDVVISLKSPIFAISVAITVSLLLKPPNLSTALIKYDPTLAGTVTEVPGLDIFSINGTEFDHSAPDVAVEKFTT